MIIIIITLILSFCNLGRRNITKLKATVQNLKFNQFKVVFGTGLFCSFVKRTRQMQQLANRLAMQHFVNAYTQETGKGHLINNDQQNPQQQAFSRGLTLLSIPIYAIQAQCYFPLSYVSRVGRHRIADLPQIIIHGQIKVFSPVTIIGLLLEALVHESAIPLDAASLIEKWIQSRDALQQFLIHREDGFDDLVKAEQSFIETEQALILGHSMHPAPKSRTGFVHEDWLKFSPEHQGKTQLHYWLVHQDYISEGSAIDESISSNSKLLCSGICLKMISIC